MSATLSGATDPSRSPFLPVRPPPDPPNVRALHDALYAGAVVQIVGNPHLRGIKAYARGLLEEFFRPHDPQTIHEDFSADALMRKAQTVQRAFSGSAEIRRLWQAIFESLGMKAHELAYDQFILRIQPHSDPKRSGADAPAASGPRIYRETWLTNLHAQVNWWGPVYPVGINRSIALYPDLWMQPMANRSACLDRSGLLQRLAEDTDHAFNPHEASPLLDEDFSGLRGTPVLVEPGTAIAFSGAQAQENICNFSSLTRFNVEIRTVLINDFMTGYDAPNVDGASPWMTPGWFRRLSDDRRLSDLAGLNPIAPATDRGTPLWANLPRDHG